jgi:hypothetical protein
LNHSTCGHKILYGDRPSKDEHLSLWSFLWKIQKYECGGQLKIEIHILFHGDNSWTVALRWMKFGSVKDNGHIYRFYFNHYFI